jgi:hypothetical protein
MSRIGTWIRAFSVALTVAISTGATAQQAPACPSSKTLPEFIKAIDNAISGPGDKDRTCLRALFRPGATLTVLTVDKSGILKPTVLTVEDWIERVQKRGSTPLYEKQVKYSAETFASMAHLWSTYEIRDTPEGAAKVRGINSIQAIHDGDDWKVAEILWQAETPSTPLPEKYLP